MFEPLVALILKFSLLRVLTIIAVKTSKSARGPNFNRSGGISGVFLVSQEGFGCVSNFPRLFQEYF